MIAFFRGAVHLQVDLLVRVFQVDGRDEVLLLKVRLGEVVHCLRVLLLGAPLLLLVPQNHHYYAEEQKKRHQPHAKADGSQVQLFTVFYAGVGAGSVG